MRALGFATALALVLATPAFADEPIATAAATDSPAPPASAPPPPLAPPLASTAPDPQAGMGPCGPEKVKPDGGLETKPHGEIQASVGTNGYRHVATAVCQPLGQDAAVAISVSATRGGAGSRRR